MGQDGEAIERLGFVAPETEVPCNEFAISEEVPDCLDKVLEEMDLTEPDLSGGVGQRCYSRFRLSIQIVTGPSLTKATFMSAPNSPVATGRPSSLDRAVIIAS